MHDMVFIGHPGQCVDDVVNICAEYTRQLQMDTGGACKPSPCEEGERCTVKVFDHGCLLPKVGHVFAIKDDYGFVLVLHEND